MEGGVKQQGQKIMMPRPKGATPRARVMMPRPKVAAPRPKAVTPRAKAVTPRAKAATPMPKAATPMPKVAAPMGLPVTSPIGLPNPQALKDYVVSKATAATSSIGALTSATSDVSKVVKSIQIWLKSNWMYITIGVLVLVGVILFVLWYMGIIFKSKPTTAKTAAVLSTAASNSPALNESTTEGFQVPTVPPQTISADEATFINLQPLSIKDTGFTGPYPNGRYDPVTATGNALKSGFRFLTLHIDYMDSIKDGFEVPGDPTLIIRASNGGLLSANSGSIAEVATTIANMAFRPEVPHNTQPVVIYLHIERTPSKLTEPNKYLEFLSKIAKALNPLANMHLGLSSLGNFTRQKMADTLLTLPLKSIEGQVIILSNADTSLFRSTSKSITKYSPSDDLDYWVNMRVYLDSENDKLGVSQLADPSFTISAVVVDLGRVLSLSDATAESFAEKGKMRYVIAMPGRVVNPTVKDLDKAINTLGVNSVPLDIFTDGTAEVMNLVSEYANMPYHPKPAALRNIS